MNAFPYGLRSHSCVRQRTDVLREEDHNTIVGVFAAEPFLILKGDYLLSAYLLARLYDACIAARLRSDRIEIFDLGADPQDQAPRWYAIDVDAFDSWLACHWLPDAPAEPLAYPDAVSFLGNGPQARGPRWYSVDDVILGYLPQSQGAYSIPAGSALPGFADLAGVSSGRGAEIPS